MNDFNFSEKQVNFLLDNYILNNLDLYCKTYGITRSKLLRRLIIEFLQNSDFPLSDGFYFLDCVSKSSDITLAPERSKAALDIRKSIPKYIRKYNNKKRT